MQSTIETTSGLQRFVRFLLAEMRPKGKLLTPFNLISVPVILLGIGILTVRFVKGLGAVTNLSQEFHTDGSFLEMTPEFFSLTCIRQARSGGISRLASLATTSFFMPASPSSIAVDTIKKPSKAQA